LSVSVIILIFATYLDKYMNSLLTTNNMMFFNTQKLDVTDNLLERGRDEQVYSLRAYTRAALALCAGVMVTGCKSKKVLSDAGASVADKQEFENQ
jgi:predicted component of viral defense system (DUF524 family)